MLYYIPVVISIGLIFTVFAKKLVVIVMFGSFILVLLTCYQNIIKSELLLDLKEVYKGFTKENHKGVNPSYIGLLSNIVGHTYRNYTNDPHSKLLLLFCASMICSQFYIDNSQFMNKILDNIFKID